MKDDGSPNRHGSMLLGLRADGTPRSKDEYVALRDRWYARIRSRGFREIEGVDGHGRANSRLGERGLVETISVSVAEELAADEDLSSDAGQVEDFLNVDTTRYDASVEYFSMCRQFLHSASRHRPRGTDRQVWLLHCEARSNREIARRLSLAKETVLRIRKRLEQAMRDWWARTKASREAEQELRLLADTGEP